ncbi:unnamed protein product [Rotaria sordida]|uniref:Uncharacterized protein n=2 Tax=Rotaria sordida TaxID=392033 RepID=A0A818L201_9BILA|nr:unnamed protein product [Rotaria sordida]CAF0840729.1 unnamed protein product [Rotaria sordida]CAF1136423.1 unnamed protein product [Rotaria sordida]CAF3564513.1 unnamed protein product [Rotaria sordida]CAF3682261.1 unnamed protein product [Rotaria sordida]
MISNPIIYTILFSIGFLLLIDSFQATPIHNDDTPIDKTYDEYLDEISQSIEKRTFSNSDIPDGYVGIMLGKRRLDGRAVRLPSEAVLLGKRRLPHEAVLLGRRDLPNEAILLGKRRIPYEAVLLGKRDLPNEAILLGKRDLPNEAILLGKRDLPNEAVLLGKRDLPNEGILLGKRR